METRPTFPKVRAISIRTQKNKYAYAFYVAKVLRLPANQENGLRASTTRGSDVVQVLHLVSHGDLDRAQALRVVSQGDLDCAQALRLVCEGDLDFRPSAAPAMSGRPRTRPSAVPSKSE